jgi:hypothetical protein
VAVAVESDRETLDPLGWVNKVVEVTKGSTIATNWDCEANSRQEPRIKVGRVCKEDTEGQEEDGHSHDIGTGQTPEYRETYHGDKNTLRGEMRTVRVWLLWLFCSSRAKRHVQVCMQSCMVSLPNWARTDKTRRHLAIAHEACAPWYLGLRLGVPYQMHSFVPASRSLT